MLDADILFDIAVARSDLRRFADHGMRQRFIAMVSAFNANGSIPDHQLAAAAGDFELLVRHRLSLERDWRENPEMAHEEIRKPIFVVGSPRTGTTLLQCLLAEDAGVQMLRYWQSHFPSPPPNLAPETVPARIEAAHGLVRQLIARLPAMLPCHPYLDAGGLAELEDEELFTLDFQSNFPFHFLNAPNLPVGAAPRDPVAAFQFHKRMLQHFQWKGNMRRWVCKGTTHQFFLPALWEIYPDATCIWPHRDPVDFIGSMLEMIAILYGPLTGRDYQPLGRAIYDEVCAGYQHVVTSDVIDDSRLIHIPFATLASAPAKAIQSIYEHANLPFTPDYEQAIAAWLADPAHRSDRHGRFAYAISDFGISLEEVRDDFAFYYQKFGLTPCE